MKRLRVPCSLFCPYRQMRKILVLFSFFTVLAATAQEITPRKQQKLSRWHIPPANYSGITWLGEDRYAVVSDKDSLDGWYEFRIQLDPAKGRVKQAERLAFHGTHTGTSARDAEGIAYFPERNTLFIAAESDQRVLEFSDSGQLTGRELQLPAQVSPDSIYGNYGLESLTYNSHTHTFWTVTEHSLKADGEKSTAGNKVPCKLRLLAFGDDLKLKGEYHYETDVPQARKENSRYAFGVSALTALDDGSLLVLEREFYVARKFMGSWVRCKIYRVFPAAQETPLKKEFMYSFTTNLNLTRRNLANYEGMCLGPVLDDGSRALLLLSDSQGGFGNSTYHLRDYIRVLRLSGF